MSVKPIEKMNDAELDAELRGYGVDPEKLVDNFISKLAAVVRAQANQIAALETLFQQQNEALERSLLAIDAFWPNDRPQNEGQASEDRVINEVRKMLRASIAAYAALFPKTGGVK